MEGMREREAELIRAREWAEEEVVKLKKSYARGVRASVESIKSTREKHGVGGAVKGLEEDDEEEEEISSP